MPNLFFIADLHLSQNTPSTFTQLQHFLDHIAHNADGLYILGDLFEAWVGDDDDCPFVAQVQSTLKAYAEHTPIYFMHGNRDFILGPDWAQKAHITLLDDPTPLTIDGHTYLLSHGDALCTDDEAYQAFRLQARNPAWQQAMLAQPLAVRKALAAKIRQQSEHDKQGKADYIMDVNTNAVHQLLQTHSYPTLIHGHTHRPAQHTHTIDDHTCLRLVLPDWHDTQGGYARLDATGLKLSFF